MKKYDVVQFAESHKWAGCFGIIDEVKNGRIMIAVPIPAQGMAYIYAFEDDVYYIGESMFEITGGEE